MVNSCSVMLTLVCMSSPELELRIFALPRRTSNVVSRLVPLIAFSYSGCLSGKLSLTDIGPIDVAQKVSKSRRREKPNVHLTHDPVMCVNSCLFCFAHSDKTAEDISSHHFWIARSSLLKFGARASCSFPFSTDSVAPCESDMSAFSEPLPMVVGDSSSVT